MQMKRRMIMKKRVSLFIVAAMLTAAFTSCNNSSNSSSSSGSSSSGGSSSSSSSTTQSSDSGSGGETGGLDASAGTFPLTTENVELNIMTQDTTYIGPFADNDFIKWYEEYTGVHVNFTEVPVDALQETVNLRLVSGDYPEILMSCSISRSQEMIYGSQGVFLPLNDYIEKWGKEMQEVFGLYDGLPNDITTPDGNIYALPNINDCFHCTYIGKLWVNQTWLQNLNMDAPTTTDEFREMLRAFKNDDPNGNGVADEIAMMGSTGWSEDVNRFLLNAFIYSPDSDTQLYLDDNGKVACAATDERYKEGLAYIHSLVEEGLIDATSYTQSSDQLKQFCLDPDAMKLGAFPQQSSHGIAGNFDDTPDNRIKNYGTIAPLTGPNGYRNTPITSTPYSNGAFIITDACKNPELAFRWADGLYNAEVTLNSQVGLEGLGRNELPEGALGINGSPALYDTIQVPSGDPREGMMRVTNIVPARRTSEFRLSQFADRNDPDAFFKNIEIMLYENTFENYAPYAHSENYLPTMYFTDEESAEVSQLTATIGAYIAEQTDLFALGTKNIETEWDSYQNEFNAMNLDRLLELYQIAYDRTH